MVIGPAFHARPPALAYGPSCFGGIGTPCWRIPCVSSGSSTLSGTGTGRHGRECDRTWCRRRRLCRMPLYYLHIRDGSDLIEDLEGSHHPSLDEACEEAVRAARQIIADRVLTNAVIDGQVFEITDDAGMVRATVPLKSVLRLE